MIIPNVGLNEWGHTFWFMEELHFALIGASSLRLDGARRVRSRDPAPAEHPSRHRQGRRRTADGRVRLELSRRGRVRTSFTNDGRAQGVEESSRIELIPLPLVALVRREAMDVRPNPAFSESRDAVPEDEWRQAHDEASIQVLLAAIGFDGPRGRTGGAQGFRQGFPESFGNARPRWGLTS